MSKFLYKLGDFAARRAWAVIGLWALILAGLGGSYAAFHGEMSDQVTIPGTEAQQLQETLSEKFDANASAGMGQIILQTKDGSAFTEEQKKAIADDVKKAEGVEQVDSVMNPFATAQQIAGGKKQLADGKKQLEDGEKKFREGEQQLNDTQAQIDSGAIEDQARQQIDDGQRQLDEQRTQLEDGERQAEEGRARLDESQAQLDEQRTRLEDGRRQLEQGQSDLDAQRAAAAGNPQALAQLEQAQAQLNQQRAQLDDGARQLEEGQRQVDEGREQLEESRPQLEEGRAKLEEGQRELDASRERLENGEIRAEAQKKVDEGRAELEKQRPELENGRAELDRNEALLDMTSDATMISDNESAAIATVSFTDEIMQVSQDHLADARNAFSDLEDKDIKVLYDTNMAGQPGEMGMTGELIGIAIALVILFVMLGTFIAAGLPIMMAVIGLAGAMLGTLALSSVVDMNSSTPALGSMLGLAVGIDYTLFILNRHRNNLAQGMDVKKSVALATGTSGSAVLFAGTTVIIALLALNVVGIPFLSVMGNAAAFAVLMAVAVAVTLSPAILSLVGRRIISKKRWAQIDRRNGVAGSIDADLAQQAHEAAQEHESRPNGWLKAILAKPWLTIVAVVVALGVVALPMTDMRLGLPTGASQAEDTPAHQTYVAVSEKFGEGQNGMIIAAAELPEGTTEAEAKELQVEVGQNLLKQEDVEKVIPAMIAKDNSMLLYQIIPAEGPSTESTETLVQSIRDEEMSTSHGDVTFGVTGQTAMNIDISKNLYDVLPIYIAIVVGLSLLVLILVFRSLWVPLTATVGFLFSLAAAFGATTAVFQWGWMGSLFGVTTPGPILSFLPILAVGILFGLAMDYQVFLVSGMREAYSHGNDGKKSVIVGYQHSAKVVVAAALIMAGVFLGFVFSGDPMIASIGFALASGVLFDAFIIRMTLVPALMYLLGDRAWALPKWLDKILPDLDVEGTQLEEHMTK